MAAGHGEGAADYTGSRGRGCIILATMHRRAARIERMRTRATPLRARRAPSVAWGAVCCAIAAVSFGILAQTHMEAAPLPAPFSGNKAGAVLPRGWEPVKLGERKRPTQYTLVEDGGVIVLHANAVGAAAGLAQFAVFDVRSAPVVEWRWKAGSLIQGADNRIASKDDAPVRLMFAFDGDKSQLSLVERAVFYLTEKLSGRELPYALLQYIWAGDIPVGTVLENPYTRRVRMLVVASGPGGVGTWQSLSRNLHDDFRHAFQEEPGLLTGIGVMTDTDNTGGSVDAWYGDIRFLPADR